MEPSKQTPKVSQQTYQTEIRVQLPPEQPNFLSKIWSAVKGIFSYIGHLFATLFHLKTTKKTEDIKAEHPVQGKPAATSVKVDTAKDVPPLNPGTPKIETPPRAATPPRPATPPPPSVPAPPKAEAAPAFSNAALFARLTDEMVTESIKLPDTLEGLTKVAELQYELLRNKEIYEKRLAYINSQKALGIATTRKIDLDMNTFKLFRYGDPVLAEFTDWRFDITRIFAGLQNTNSPTLSVPELRTIARGLQNRYRFKDDEIKLLEQLVNAQWPKNGYTPPSNIINLVICAVITESKIPLPKTLDEAWHDFYLFDKRMEDRAAQSFQMTMALWKQDAELARLIEEYDPFPGSDRFARFESWMRDYHKFDAACPHVEIPVNCRHDERLVERIPNVRNPQKKYLLSQQLVWKPAEGKFYVKLGQLDWKMIDKTGEWLDEERPISTLDRFIGVPYTVKGTKTEEGVDYPRIEVEDTLYFDPKGNCPYIHVEKAFTPEILDAMIQSLRQHKINKQT